ncbi:MAG TPA: hypothetical protein VLL54_14595 [Pyrinomonadaceae bacterium]|nr:hypothetical protein [Pyrinomonadaceae bacterium]
MATNYTSLLQKLATRRPAGAPPQAPGLIAAPDIAEFVGVSLRTLDESESREILARAIEFRTGSDTTTLEISFVGLFAALESVLTFFRRQNDYDILEPEVFASLQQDLKKWLKQHAALAHESAKRALIYEKFRELNRFPFSHVFNKFCEHYSLDLTDLWPLVGKHADWPLTEIRHRLVHGDPFVSRPPEALACANLHLTWTVERMLLCELGWPVERSNVSAGNLQGWREHTAWPAERAKFA